MPTPRGGTAAAAKRMRQAINNPSAAVPPEIRNNIALHRPRSVTADRWSYLAPVVTEAIARSRVRSPESMRKHITHLGLFYAWAEREGLSPSLDTLTRANIEVYVSTGMAGSSAKSRADRRSRLRAIADRLQPADGPPPGPRISKPLVRPPYEEAEMAVLKRDAFDQPTAVLRRAMCLCVGLGAGAGLSSSDFRSLRGGHVADRGDAGLVVDVPGDRPRRVPVLEAWEQLVRVGLEEVGGDELLLPGREDRRNLAARAVEQAVLSPAMPRVEQSRLRHTWMATMLAAAVPLQTLMEAAGLRSARTLTDVLAFLPPPPPASLDRLRLEGGEVW